MPIPKLKIVRLWRLWRLLYKHCLGHNKCLLSLLAVTMIPAWLLLSCSTAPPTHMDNSCDIFKEKRGWYPQARRSARRWGVSIGTQLAIIHQESKFKSEAKSPRTHILWIIPWTRRSTAYGYAQVVDNTWDWYRRDTGNRHADRDDFDDAVDFVGWYVYTSSKLLHIPKQDAFRHYLAFHEGHGGYQKKTYRKKPWLIKAARKVAMRAKRYDRQLKSCEKELRRYRWWWPF